MRTQRSSQKKVMNMCRIIKSPVRAISKVLDLYVKGVTSFSNTYNRPLGYTVEVTRTSQKLPRSFTTGSLSDNNVINDQPPHEAFIRSISTGTLCGNNNDNDNDNNIKITDLQLLMIQRHWQQFAQLTASRKAMSRSCVVAMGKIDEDRVSSFRNDNIVFKNKIAGIINDEDDSVCSKMVSTKRIKLI